MGLKGDWQEVVTVWKQSPRWVKAYLALSAFLASGPIASLSETVFRWKGFIRDALSFYQAYVSDQLLHVLKFVFATVHVPAGVSDLLILSALYLGANMRVARFAVPGARSRAIASLATTSYLAAMIVILIAMDFKGKELDGESAFSLFLGSALAASGSYWFVGGAARILWFVCLFGPFVIVGLLAAVSSGLVRVA